MSVADATRFVMLKKPATAAMSQISRSEKPARRKRLAVLFLDQPRLGGELDGEIEHGAFALRQPRRAVIHRHQFAEHRIAGQLAHGGAVGDQTIIAAVLRRDRDRDHFALELAQARRRQHQIVVHGDEGRELAHVEGVGLEHVGHEAELFLAFGEIGGHLGGQRCRRKLKRGDHRVVGRCRAEVRAWRWRASSWLRCCAWPWCVTSIGAGLPWRRSVIISGAL